MTGTVYGLTSAADEGLIRYIGYTTRPLWKRMKGHRADALVKERSVCRWIAQRVSEGIDIQAIVLKRPAVLADEIAAISEFKSKGFDLLNETAGGMGTHGRAITPAMQAVFQAPASETLKAGLREFNAARDYATVGERMTAHWSDPAEREAHSVRLKAAKAARTAEQRAATAEKTRLYWADPENRRKHSEKIQAARAARLAKEPPC